jgi:hypothetical protein
MRRFCCFILSNNIPRCSISSTGFHCDILVASSSLLTTALLATLRFNAPSSARVCVPPLKS